MPESTGTDLISRLRLAFWQHGYEALSMVELARACGMSRRALYYHFPNKEAAFRTMIREGSVRSIAAGLAAGRSMRQAGGTPVEIFSEILNIRFGETRRMVESSAHVLELNAVAFLKCRDLMIDAATTFQQELADIVVALAEEGTIALRPDFSPADVAQTLANGARGVNQSLPPAPSETLVRRYRQMCEAVLFGAVEAGQVVRLKYRATR